MGFLRMLNKSILCNWVFNLRWTRKIVVSFIAFKLYLTLKNNKLNYLSLKTIVLTDSYSVGVVKC